MEKLTYSFAGGDRPKAERPVVLVGVVSSGNLEVLVEEAELQGRCQILVSTSVKGFGQIWEALLSDFAARHPLADLRFSINDAGATPAVVSLRMEQALEEFLGGPS